MFSMAPLMKNNKIAVATFSGAAGILVMDALRDTELEIGNLSEDTAAKLVKLAPAWLKVGNPVPWAADCQACFQGKGGAVTLAGPMAANGLQLGAGYTLALSRHRLACTWHAVLQPNSTLAVTLAPGDGKGDGALRLQVAGNLDLAGTLVITAEGDLPDGDYRIVRSDEAQYHYLVAPDTGTCLGVGEQGGIAEEPLAGTRAQKWKLLFRDAGAFVIQSRADGTVITLQDGQELCSRAPRGTRDELWLIR
jgi:hypothetical protein